MSSLNVAREDLALAVSYLNKAEARDKICRAIQYGSMFLSNGEPGTAQNVDKSTSLARKVFRLFKVSLSSRFCWYIAVFSIYCIQLVRSFWPFGVDRFFWFAVRQ